MRLPSAPAQTISPEDRLRVGTLTYTKAGLIALFAWLLWGDFCYTLHEVVVNACLPLAMKRNGAPNVLMGMLLVSLPGAINFTLNPIISTMSDRTRTKWGRRRPYLIFTAPLNAACLILLAFSEDIGRALQHTFHDLSPTTVMITVITVCFVMFRVTDMFVATVYYYLFNDVVPKAVLARFVTLFRVVGTGAGSLFSFFFYKHAETHMREIFLGAGVLYLIGYTLMCLKVKEGEYPPPPASMQGASKLAMMKTYFRECFTDKFFVYFFVSNAAWAMPAGVGVFGVFLARDSLGINLDQLGKIGGIAGVCSMVCLMGAGFLADRIHPLRFMVGTMFLQAVVGLASLNWLFWNPTPTQALHIMIILTAVGIPLSAMHQAASWPLLMRVLPKDRFGQFAAANQMVSALAVIISGALAGGFIDLMKWLHHGSNYAYRYIPVWQSFFCFLAVFLLYRLYRLWLSRGGEQGEEAATAATAAPVDPEPVIADVPAPASEKT